MTKRPALRIALTALVASAMALFATSAPALAAVGDSWSAGTSGTTKSFYLDAAYGNGTWVAIAQQEISTSADGKTWTVVSDPSVTAALTATGSYFTQIEFGQGKFLILTSLYSITSTDGVHWGTAHALPDPGDSTDVRWGTLSSGPNGFMAGESGDCLSIGNMIYSPDGINWTLSAVNELDTCVYSITNRTVGGVSTWIVGTDAGSWLYSSTDNGTTWNPVTYVGTEPTGPIQSVAYGDGKFLAVSGAISGPVFTSNDGLSWSAPHNILQTPSYGQWVVAFGNGRFVISDGPDSFHGIFSTEDGVTFTPTGTLPPGLQGVFGLSYKSNQMLAIGYGGDSHVNIAYSGEVVPDGAETAAGGSLPNTGMSASPFILVALLALTMGTAITTMSLRRRVRPAQSRRGVE